MGAQPIVSKGRRRRGRFPDVGAPELDELEALVPHSRYDDGVSVLVRCGGCDRVLGDVSIGAWPVGDDLDAGVWGGGQPRHGDSLGDPTGWRWECPCEEVHVRNTYRLWPAWRDAVERGTDLYL